MKISILLSLILGNTLVFSQTTEISTTLAKYCIPISKSPTSYSFLDSVIQNKRIIFLGEYYHNDAKTIEKKTEIIKYLIENHDFQAVIFEGGLFEMEQLRLLSKRDFNNDMLAKTSFFNSNSFYTNEKYLLGKYILENKIEFGGLDIAYGNWLVSQLSIYLDEVFKENGKFNRTNRKLIDKYCSELNRIVIDFQFRYQSNRNMDIKTFMSSKDAILIQLKSFHKSERVQFVEQVLRSDDYLVNWIKNRTPYDPLNRMESAARFHAIRDSAMAINLTWLVNNKFKEKKIVVSTSTYHQFRSSQEPYPMVSLLPQDILNESLFFPIIWYNKLDQNSELLRKHPKFSLAYYLSTMGKEDVFLSFKSDEVKNVVDSLEINFTDFIPQRLKWSEIFDGVFYIDTMNFITEKNISMEELDYFQNVIRKN